MKKLITLVAVTAVAVCVFAQETSKVKRTRPRRGAPSGGLLTKEYKGKWLKILDGQSRVDNAVLSKIAEEIKFESALPVVVERVSKLTDGNPFKTAEAATKADAAAVLLVVDDETSRGMLVAPEEAWAMMNVAKLAVDFPSDKRLEERVRKEVWRGICLALGAGNSTFQPCLMKPIYSLSALDACELSKPGPEPFNKMIESARLRGATTLTFATYRDACRQGWAPGPTNDVQKAIWDEIHAIPQKPLKIEFDPKMDKK